MLGEGKVKKILITLFILTFALISNLWAESGYKMVDTSRLHSMVMDNAHELESGRASQFMIIDARAQEEYNESHIFTAIDVSEKDFEESVNLLPNNKGVLLVIYCNDSGVSRKWLDKAKTAGYTNVVIYSDRFSVWKERNMPVAPL